MEARVSHCPGVYQRVVRGLFVVLSQVPYRLFLVECDQCTFQRDVIVKRIRRVGQVYSLGWTFPFFSVSPHFVHDQVLQFVHLW